VKKKLFSFLARKAAEILRRSRYSGVKTVERMSEVPDKTGSFIFIVERGGHAQWAVFDCPCRRGHRLTVSLRKSDHPHWSIRWRGEKLSLSPSLWLTNDCKSHFWIRDNKVTWV
jgi:hypothetical protein